MKSTVKVGIELALSSDFVLHFFENFVDVTEPIDVKQIH